jgi:penicillin-binding protein 1A
MKEAAADPTLGIDTKLTFVKPDAMGSDIEIDWINGNVPILGGEGDDMGTGNSGDYEVPKDIKIDDIVPIESQPIKDQKPKPKKPGENTPPPAGKAVMPPPPKKPGGRK